MLKYDFSKRLTVITGGASGIGKGIALAFAENASDLAIMDINQEAGGELALELTKKFNIRASFYKCNVADFEETQAAGAKIISDYNRIDNLIIAAGYGSKVSIAELGFDEWKKTIDVNLNGTFFVIKAFIKKFIEQRMGNIILIGSGAVVTGGGGGVHYAATKVAQYGICKALSYELLSLGIRSNIITPHIIDTPMLRKRYPDNPDTNAKLNQRVPIGRIGLPSDIANIALFLAAEESSYICGADIIADGGSLFYQGFSTK